MSNSIKLKTNNFITTITDGLIEQTISSAGPSHTKMVYYMYNPKMVQVSYQISNVLEAQIFKKKQYSDLGVLSVSHILPKNWFRKLRPFKCASVAFNKKHSRIQCLTVIFFVIWPDSSFIHVNIHACIAPKNITFYDRPPVYESLEGPLLEK